MSCGKSLDVDFCASIGESDTTRLNTARMIRVFLMMLLGLLLPAIMFSLLLVPHNARAGYQAQPFRFPGDLLEEGFEAVTFPPTGWGTTIVSGSTQGWSRQTMGIAPTASPHSGVGMARFYSFMMTTGNSTRLYTPVIDLTGQITPTLEFWMYHDIDSTDNDRIDIQISTNGGTSYTTTLTTVNRYTGETGWKLHAVDLSAYIGQSNVRLGLLGISDWGRNIFIDDVRVGLPTEFSEVYLPIVTKPAPPPPEGHWEGATSYGLPMEFYVLSGGTLWSKFKLTSTYVLGGCSGTTTSMVAGPGAITNNQFSSSGSLSFTGHLDTLTSATGTYIHNISTPCGTVIKTGTWSATLQPSQ